MRFLFAVQGEGRGHLTQALTLEKMLRKNGHEVVKMLVRKSRNRRLPEFFLKKANAPVETFNSPNFLPSKDNCHIGHLNSTLYNIARLPQYISSMLRIRSAIIESGADIVVNFYEVLCGVTFFLFNPGVPEVCIGHQYLFLHPDFKFPKRHVHSQWWLRFFTRLTCLGASRMLALSMREYPDTNDNRRSSESHQACLNGRVVTEEDEVNRLITVPPLLRDEIKYAARSHGSHITGYILNAGFAKSVMEWHKKHTDIPLEFFWDKKDVEEETVFDPTLKFHRIDDKAFIKSISESMAYATTGGFESVCEALYMGKPVIMVPAHIEQECNAYDAELEGAGISSDSFDLDKLLDFSKNYKRNIGFRIWENSAETRIIAILESVANDSISQSSTTFILPALQG